jgi:hypothetical protein
MAPPIGAEGKVEISREMTAQNLKGGVTFICDPIIAPR